MTLQEKNRLDILHEAKRDALRHAQVWLDIAQYLENEIGNEYNETISDGVYPTDSVTYSDPSVQWSFTGEERQGDNLPRNGERKQPVRYHRGSKASDEGPLRQ